MPPSHVRKEEAELRQIAKQSRQARKEAQERERKQRQRAMRAAAKAAASGADAAATTPAAASAEAVAASKAKKRGAIILPEEVMEMRQRLYGEKQANGAETSASASKKKSAKKSKKNTAAAAVSTSSGASSASSSSSSFLVPAYHQEVHFKKQILFVDVVLHHVPPQKINVSETTNEQLVVDTAGFTKKYRLVLPFPDGMRCDAANAVFDMERGVLSCKLPILDGTVPAALTEENAKMVEAMRRQKALRFRVSQDGDLTVRTRQALLAPTLAAQAELQTAKKGAVEEEESEKKMKKESATSKKRSRAAAAGEEEEEVEAVAVTAESPTKASKKATGKKTVSPALANEKAENVPKAESNNGTSAGAATKVQKPSVFEAEHAKSMAAAEAAVASVRLSMQQKLRLAKTVQASRQVRLDTRTVRKEHKVAKQQDAFQRVLEQQKRQLLEQATLQKPAAPRAAGKDGAAKKSVSFASA